MFLYSQNGYGQMSYEGPSYAHSTHGYYQLSPPPDSSLVLPSFRAPQPSTEFYTGQGQISKRRVSMNSSLR